MTTTTRPDDDFTAATRGCSEILHYTQWYGLPLMLQCRTKLRKGLRSWIFPAHSLIQCISHRYCILLGLNPSNGHTNVVTLCRRWTWHVHVWIAADVAFCAPPTEVSICSYRIHDARGYLIVAFQFKPWLWLRLCESDVLSSVFASPFAHITDCLCLWFCKTNPIALFCFANVYTYMLKRFLFHIIWKCFLSSRPLTRHINMWNGSELNILSPRINHYHWCFKYDLKWLWRPVWRNASDVT